MRQLSEKEIEVLTGNGCRAENWQAIRVGEGFVAERIQDVRFRGRVKIGAFETEPPIRRVAVLNEAGEETMLLSRNLTGEVVESLLAGEMVEETTFPACSEPILIDGCGLLEDCYIGGGTRIDGALKLKGCTIENAYIGTGVIAENSVVVAEAKVDNGARLKHSFVGEASTLTDGFSAENSIFFVNSYMANGEACASVCGPYAVSHHKSTLLIGGRYSFYNAGSGTNFSNHAYKLGPIHYGTLHRGSKTASGCHIIWPAEIGAFSVCMNKISSHPVTIGLPFSYVIGDGLQTRVVPGKVIGTAGFYRDIQKWPKRDERKEKRTKVDFSVITPALRSQMENAIEWLTMAERKDGRLIGQGFYVLEKDVEAALRFYGTYLLVDEDDEVRADWLAWLIEDAEHELALGDVKQEALDAFLATLK